VSATSVEIVEVSPRDGLQNESQAVSTEDKLRLIERAVNAGIRRLEIASFVNPKRVPQMADAEEVIAKAPRSEDVTYIGLVMNQRGAERALDTNIDQLGAITLCSDTFAKKNQGQTALETLEVALGVIRLARAEGRSATVMISSAFGCPFEGEISETDVIDYAKRLAEAEPCEIALADTIGVGDPWRVAALFDKLREAVPGMPLRGHFHNTRNTGIANAYAAIQAGVTAIDASVGGLGGCPFAPAATGNIATEDLVYMLDRGGIETGVDLAKLMDTCSWMNDVVGRQLPAMVSRAGIQFSTINYRPEEEQK
jgi:hydroxymethylglutaryl-CoA lyase